MAASPNWLAIRAAEATTSQHVSGGILGAPVMKLRGTCVAMQKTFILPGRHVYEYPYTPELFPWFYDKKLWAEYLDFLVENRMNTLYLWSGHPFASLVRLEDYPYAVEVPEDTFQKNPGTISLAYAGVRQARHLARADVLQYHRVEALRRNATALARSFARRRRSPGDYTRKSIAEFVKQYPNVGLMCCLGEALEGTSIIQTGVVHERDFARRAGRNARCRPEGRAARGDPHACHGPIRHHARRVSGVFQPLHGIKIQRRIAHHIRAARQVAGDPPGS